MPDKLMGQSTPFNLIRHDIKELLTFPVHEICNNTDSDCRLKPLMAQVSKVTMKLVILPPAPLESGPGAYQIPQIGSSHRVRHTQWHWRDLKCIRSEESQRKGRSDWMEMACAISVGSNRGGCFIFPARASALGPTWRRNVQPRLGTVFVTQIHTRHFQLRGRRHPGHKNAKMEHQNRAVTTIGTKTDWKCVKEGTRQMQLELMSRWDAGEREQGRYRPGRG